MRAACPCARRVLRRAAEVTWHARLQPAPPGWIDLALGVPLMDTGAARRELGWEPRHTGAEALMELLEGIRDGADHPTPPLAARDQRRPALRRAARRDRRARARPRRRLTMSDEPHPSTPARTARRTTRSRPPAGCPRRWRRCERARGHLYSFHQLIGEADLKLDDALELLRACGATALADGVERDLVGRNVLPGRWTFQVVEEFDEQYWSVFRAHEAAVRDALVDGRRHVYEAEMKERRRTHGHPGHGARP